MVRRIKFTIITSCLLLSCNQTQEKKSSALDKNLASKGSGSEQNSGSTSKSGKKQIVENFGSTTFSSLDMSQEDNSLIAAAQRSQDLMNKTDKLNTVTATPTRTDNFYKCGKILSHAYIVIDPAAKPTATAAAMKMKDSLHVISADIREDKLGAFEAYMAAVDKDANVFVFYSTNSTREVYYSWQDNTGNWRVPTSFTKVSGQVALATASFDIASQKVVVQIYSVADKKLYTYTQTEGGNFSKTDDGKAITQAAFDELQAKNGTTLEINNHISLHAIPSLAPDPGIFSSLLKKAMDNVMTIGLVSIANAVHTEEELQASTYLKEMQYKICNAPAPVK